MKKPWDKNKNKNERRPNLMQGQDDYAFSRSRTIASKRSEADSQQSPTRRLTPREKFKTERAKSIVQRKHRQKVVNVISGMLILVGAIALLAADFVLNPNIVTAQQGIGKSFDIQPYKDSINSYFGQHPLERLSFLLKEENLNSFIADEHPELSDIKVSRNWYGGNSVFDIYFREPILVWKVEAGEYYVDKNGVSFTYNYFSEPTLEVSDQSGLTLNQNNVVASTSFIEFLGQIVSAVNSYSYGRVVEVIVPSATREVDLKLEGRDYVIRASTDRDAAQEAEDIANSLKYFDEHSIVPQYIDVRVAHRAYYQ